MITRPWPSAEQQAFRAAAQSSYAERHPGRSVDDDSALAHVMAAARYTLDWRDRIYVRSKRDLRGKTELEEFPPLPDWVGNGLIDLGAYLEAAKQNPEAPFLVEITSSFAIEKTLAFVRGVPFPLVQAQLRVGHALERLKRPAKRKAKPIDQEAIASILAPYREVRRATGDGDAPSDATLLGEAIMTHAMMWTPPRKKGPRHRPGSSEITAFVHYLRLAFQQKNLGAPSIDDYVDAWMYMTATGPRATVYRVIHRKLTRRGVVEPLRTGRGVHGPRKDPGKQ